MLLRKVFFIFIISIFASLVFAKENTVFTIGKIEDYDWLGEHIQAEIKVGDKSVYIRRQADAPPRFRDYGNELDIYIDDTFYKLYVEKNEYNQDYVLTPEVLDGIKKAKKKIVFISPKIKCVFEGKNLKLLKEFLAIKLRPRTVKPDD